MCKAGEAEGFSKRLPPLIASKPVEQRERNWAIIKTQALPTSACDTEHDQEDNWRGKCITIN